MAVSSYYSFSPNNKCCNYFIKLYLLLQKHNRFLTKKTSENATGFQRFPCIPLAIKGQAAKIESMLLCGREIFGIFDVRVYVLYVVVFFELVDELLHFFGRCRIDLRVRIGDHAHLRGKRF